MVWQFSISSRTYIAQTFTNLWYIHIPQLPNGKWNQNHFVIIQIRNHWAREEEKKNGTFMDSTRFKNESVFMCKLFFLNSFEAEHLHEHWTSKQNLSVRFVTQKYQLEYCVYLYAPRVHEHRKTYLKIHGCGLNYTARHNHPTILIFPFSVFQKRC